MFPIIFNGVPWQPLGKMAVSSLRMTALMGVLLVAVVALLGRVEDWGSYTGSLGGGRL
ncbi:hypothetical protein [Salinibaculum salinum]|uniref:hypothetical protein n=1 Tax=Salinibaculum salinum TaxID=3131996 RepID=UPI0030EDD469